MAQRQMTGSFQNRIMESSQQQDPEVGMGATITRYTDREAGTIVEVIRFKTGQRAGEVKAVVVQYDRATRTDSNGMSDAQSYEYEADPNGGLVTVKLGRDGRYGDSASGLRIGSRDKHHDYSF
jgi:hypothetical protein